MSFRKLLLQINNRRPGYKTVCGFSSIFLERNYDVLKSKCPCFLLNKTINFNKNETDSKMETSTNSFREMNLVFQLVLELRIKKETVMSWSSRKTKERIFYNTYFVQTKFFHIYLIV